MPQEELSLRESLENAFDADQQQQEHVDSDVATEVSGDRGKPPPKDVGLGSEEPGEGQLDGEEAKSSLRQRDENGKFVKGGKTVKPVAVADKGSDGGPAKEAPIQKQPVKVAAQAQQDTVEEAQRRLAASRAPGSWRPAIREKWARLDPEVQQEILRRERDMTRGMTETTAAREFQGEFARTLAPYQHIIAAEGGHPLAVVSNLLATAAALSHGSPQQKAQTAAAIINNFNVDLQMLDNILAQGGAAPPQNGGAALGGNPMMAQHYIQQEVQRALAPVLGAQQQRQNQLEESVNEDIDAFAADPKNEFFEDVREIMADVLEIAAKRGQKMDLSTAYNHATLMHSEIAPIVQARNLQAKVTPAHQAAQAARKKAVSVTGAPAAASGATNRGESLRDDLENAIDQLSS